MITSTANPKIKRLLNLRKKHKAREEEGVFLAEGPRMAGEALGEDIREIFVSESFQGKDPVFVEQIVQKGGVTPEVLSDDVFSHVSDTRTPQGILLVLSQKAYTLDDLLELAAGEEPSLFLILENIQDPGNLGTLFRTAEAAGVIGILLSRDTADIYNPKVIRSTMGSVFRMPFCYTEDLPAALAKVREQGIRIFAADLGGAVPYDQEDYRNQSAFLIGNEGNGLTKESLELADSHVKIPMKGQVESLNASAAGAVLLFEAARQRRSNTCAPGADIVR